MGHPLRTRKRGGEYSPLSGTLTHFWPQDAPHPNPVQYTCHSQQCYKKWQLMIDTHGYLEDDFNPCYHERFVGVYDFPKDRTWQDSRGYLHSLETTFHPSLKDPIVDCRSIPLPIGTWLQDFSARAEYHYTVLVDTDDSLINFIIEAIELMEGNASLLERLKEGIEGALKAFRRKFAETGNYWLSWNFAIKPTIADLKAMVQTYRRAEKRLKWLRSRNHKNTKVKYREGPREYTGTCTFAMADITVDHPYFNPTPVLVGKPPNQTWLEWPDWLALVDECEVEYFARVNLSSWAWIRFDIPDEYLDEVYGLGIVIAAMQGLYNPLAIGWEAVPFSWLIDWFRTESHKLRELLKSDVNPLGHATILQTGWTLDMTIFGDLNYRVGMIADNGSIDSTPPHEAWTKRPAGAFRYKLYNRQPGLPDVSSSPFRIPWEWYNASILAALIQQKKRRG